MIRINLLGVWWTLKYVLPDVIERRGYLLPVASLAAAVPTPLIAAYGAAKSGVHSISRTLRFELAHTGAKVGCAYFAEIDTDMTRVAHKVPIIERSLRAIPEPLHRVQPVEVASKAVVRGIEKRSRRVTVPRWVNWTVSWNGLGRAVRGDRRPRPALRPQLEAGARRGRAVADAAAGRGARDARGRGGRPVSQNGDRVDHEVAIIGAGFSGLGMAAALKRIEHPGLRHLRAGRRRRRDLAGQHLSRASGSTSPPSPTSSPTSSSPTGRASSPRATR